MKDGTHIVLIGLNFSLERQEGDKNFWIELLPLLAAEIRRITVFSLKDHPVPVEEKTIGGCRVVINYLPPRLIQIGERKKKRLIKRGDGFPAAWGVVEKFLSGKKITAELKRLAREDPYQCIHLMDNMGLTNRIIARAADTGVSVSAMAYQGKNRLVYNNYLRLSYRHPKLTVVPYSESFAEELIRIGIPPERIRQIRWGVAVGEGNRPPAEAGRHRSWFSIPSGKTLYLWAGYIQQIRRKEFLLAYRCARRALEKGLDGVFFFAFKSEEMAEEFYRYHHPGRGIHIQVTTVEEFRILKRIADVFYSPFCREDIIIAPPLTWLEVMSLGKPVVTTAAGGAGEIIDNGKTGFIARGEDDLLAGLFKIRGRYPEMARDCRKIIEDKYNIAKTAERYLDLFRRRG